MLLRLLIVLLLLCGAGLGVVLLVRYLPKVFLYGLVAAGMSIQFVAKKISIAVPWIISAVVAVMFGFYALARQFFVNEDAKLFIERKLSPKNSPHKKTFSLLTIGLMLEFHEKFLGTSRHGDKV